MLATSNRVDTAEGRTTPGSLPLYIAGYLVTLSALMSMGLILDEDPGFISLVMGLSAIGFAVSFLLRRQSINAYSVELPAAAVCVLLAIAATTDRGIPFLAPAGLDGDRAKTLAVMLTWITVFRSFTLITDGSVLFSCVLSIAIMGLVGTMNSDPTLTRYYALFVAAAAFMMVHESFISARRRQASAARPKQPRFFASQIQIAILCAVGALILAIPVAAPLQALGSLLAFTPSTPGVVQQQRSTDTATRISIVEQPNVSVGTGPVSLSDQQVMRIRANQASHWRGATFNVYTGRGWSTTLDETEFITPSSPGESTDVFAEPQGGLNRYTFHIQPNEFSDNRGSNSYELIQYVRFVGNGLFQDIYGAPEITSLTMAEDRAQVDLTGGIRLFRPVQNFDYLVKSRVADSRPETLRASSGEYPRAIRENYLGTLDTAGQTSLSRVRETAEEITRGKVSTYDKVEALKSWIEERCKYNTGAAAYPVDVDVTEHFLFTAQEGYCDSFATALAVLCRSIGIPSRVASGFAPGRFDSESMEWVVAEKDKHLWTEVYFPNVGWVARDATEGAEDISERTEQSQIRQSGSLLGFLFSRGPLPPLALVLMLAMLAYVFKVEVWDRYRPRRRPLEQLGLPANNAAVIEAYEAACKSIARLGRPRLPFVTPREYLADIRHALADYPEVIVKLDRITAMAIDARYSKVTITDADTESAKSIVSDLKKALKPIRRKALMARPVPEPA